MMQKKLAFSFGILLAVTGAAKLVSGFGSARLLSVNEPIFEIPFKHLIIAIGALEFAIAILCLFNVTQRLMIALVAWLATSFLLYRAVLRWLGWQKPCNCLGDFTDALHISPQVTDNIMKVVLAYLLIGSYGLLIWEWRKSRRQRTEGRGQVTESQADSAEPIVDGR